MRFIPLNIKTCYSFFQSTISQRDLGELPATFAIVDRHFAALPSFYAEVQKRGGKLLVGLEKDDYLIYPKNNNGLSQLYRSVHQEVADSADLIFVYRLTNKIKGLIDQGESDAVVGMINQEVGKYSHFYLGLEAYSNEDQKYLDVFRQTGLPCVVVNQCLCLDQFDAQVLQCLRSAGSLPKVELPLTYLVNFQTLSELFFVAELEATVQLADKCSINPFDLQAAAPVFPLAAEKSEYLRVLAYKGLAKRFSLKVKESYKTRLDYELKIVNDLGFVDYFLIVADYVRYAIKKGYLVGPGRGSACGSLISYCLGITSVDPLQYDLVFERFLNPMRQGRPDIDIDFPDYARNDIVNYLISKYGKDQVLAIGAYQSYGARSALKDAGAFLGLDRRIIVSLTKAIPSGMGLKQAIASIPTITRSAEIYTQLFTFAKRLEGLPRNKSVHPSGIIIAGQSLNGIFPYEESSVPVCQFDMTYIEQLGGYKFDLLSLNNLSIIADALSLIGADQMALINQFDLNDPQALSLINSGRTDGIFQLESIGMRKAIQEIQPSNFLEVVDLLALYRPGPMAMISEYQAVKRGKRIHVAWRGLAPILQPTKGIIIYQEQIMAITQEFGLSAAEADLFRRAISKKSDQFIALKRDFFNGAERQGIPLPVVEEVYALIEKFSGYGFNKAHAVAYAHLSMWMAILKSKYPKAFFAALLNYSDGAQRQALIDKGRAGGLIFTSPNVQVAGLKYVIEQGQIVLPLTAVKSITTAAAQAIIAEREKALFASFYDFIFRMNGKITAESIRQLIVAGALDHLEALTRSVMLGSLDGAMQYAAAAVIGLPLAPFSLKDALINQSDIIKLEKEALGLQMDFSALKSIKQQGLTPVARVYSKNGMIKVALFIRSKAESKGMVELVGEDDSGAIKFSLTYPLYNKIKVAALIAQPILVTGQVKKELRTWTISQVEVI